MDLFNNDNSTVGASPTQYQPADTASTEPTTVSDPKKYTGGSLNLLDIAPTMRELAKDAPFTFTVIAIVGYIIIAAFGGIESVGQFFGYVSFIFVSFFIYSITREDSFIYKYVIAILIAALIATNWTTLKTLPYMALETIKQLLKTTVPPDVQIKSEE